MFCLLHAADNNVHAGNNEEPRPFPLDFFKALSQHLKQVLRTNAAHKPSIDAAKKEIDNIKLMLELGLIPDPERADTEKTLQKVDSLMLELSEI